VLGVLSVGLLMVGLDTTVLNVALPVLVRDLHATTTQLQWIVAAYALLDGGLVLFAGSLADRIGRKTTFLAGLALFAVGSAAAAYSGSPNRLIAARGLMGIGAALIMPSSLAIIATLFRGSTERIRAIGIWSAAVGVGIAIGPLLGGWLLGHFWWGSVFLVNVPIAFAGVAAASWLVPATRASVARRFDLGGVLLSVAGLGAVLWAVIEAPVYGWGSTAAIGGLGVGIVLLAAFVGWEKRSTNPMLPLGIFRHRRLAVGDLLVFLGMFALLGALFLLVQYLQFVLGYGAAQTGLRLAPAALVILVAGPLSSLLAERAGAPAVVAVGLGATGAALALLATATLESGYPRALVAMILLGIGAGFTISPTTDAIIGSLDEADLGIGSATNSAAVQVGSSFGVAVLGSLASTTYGDHLDHGAAAVILRGLPPSASDAARGSLGGALGVVQQLPGELAQRLSVAAREAFLAGMHTAMLTGAVVAAVGVMIALLLMPSGSSDEGGQGGRVHEPDSESGSPHSHPPQRTGPPSEGGA
jgi:EmrB/QacA subfamily drug resistance transporter